MYVHSGIPFKGEMAAILEFAAIFDFRIWIKCKFLVILVESKTH